MTFTLYSYVLSGNCYKVRLMAALLGAAHDTVAVDFYPGREHRSAAMLALNPAGTLPVLTAGDLVLTQSQAMLTWLASTYDPAGTWFPTRDAAHLAQVQDWLGFADRLSQNVGSARLHDMLGWPVDVDAAKAAAREDLRVLELHLTDRVIDGAQWLVADAPSIADIACFAYAALSPDAGLEHDAYPAIRNWIYRVKALPGFITMPGIHHLHELGG